MPTISRFYAIVIRMYFNGHPPPHFHALYNGYEALINIKELRIEQGSLPKRALTLTLEWAELHQDELFENWELACQNKPLNPIKPLE